MAVFALGAIFFYFLGGFIIAAVSPLWNAENAISRTVNSRIEHWRREQKLIDENAMLREKILSLEAELYNRSALANVESSILSMLGRTPLDSGIASSVLVRPPETPYDIITIDAGEREGVSLGMEAALVEGPLLGTISEVFSNNSKVKLFSSPGEKTNAVLERSGTAVALEGTGGGNFTAAVPRETPVEVGDRIISADIFGRLLAVVEEIKLEQTDSFKEVLSRSPANIFNVRYVILRP